MIFVNVATLKEKLSYYLGVVRDGSEIVITSYRSKIGKIVPITSGDLEIRNPSRPPADLRKLKGVKTKTGSAAVDLLLEDRRKR